MIYTNNSVKLLLLIIRVHENERDFLFPEKGSILFLRIQYTDSGEVGEFGEALIFQGLCREFVAF
ncbi:MAG: hypothetical protein GKR96_11065 [Gammaproteobacteria bacterium]|nr:hypothetical protein [Gammaproteobacteria bacterium]